MITCREIEDKAQAFLDGEAPPDEHDAIKVHVDECATCATTLAERLVVATSLAEALGREALPDSFGVTTIIHGDEALVPDDPFAPTVAGEAASGELSVSSDLVSEERATELAPPSPEGESADEALEPKRASPEGSEPKRRKRVRSTAEAGPELVGSVLGGYQIVSLLAKGGMGTVYRAKQLSMDRVVALKVLAPRLAERPAFVKRFMREARAAAALEHPNLVRIYDISEARGYFYYSMEFVEGESLAARIARLGALQPQHVVEVGLACATALECARSQNIVHRDIKPPNILLGADGTTRLADLGLAKWTDASADESGSLTTDGTMMGSPNYMAPEQARDPKSADHVSDLYALGATLYHAASGAVPHKAATALDVIARSLNEDLLGPDDPNAAKIAGPLHAVLSRMVARDRRARFQQASEVMVALEALTHADWSRAAAPPARAASQRTPRGSSRVATPGQRPVRRGSARAGAGAGASDAERRHSPSSGVAAVGVARPRAPRSSGTRGLVVAAAVILSLTAAFLWVLRKVTDEGAPSDGRIAESRPELTPKPAPTPVPQPEPEPKPRARLEKAPEPEPSATAPIEIPTSDKTEDERAAEALRKLLGEETAPTPEPEPKPEPAKVPTPEPTPEPEPAPTPEPERAVAEKPTEPEAPESPTGDAVLAGRFDEAVRGALEELAAGADETPRRELLAAMAQEPAVAAHATYPRAIAGVLESARVVDDVRARAFETLKDSERGHIDGVRLLDGTTVRGRLAGVMDNPRALIVQGAGGVRRVSPAEIAPADLLRHSRYPKGIDHDRASIVLDLCAGMLRPAEKELEELAARTGDDGRAAREWRAGLGALLAAARAIEADRELAEGSEQPEPTPGEKPEEPTELAGGHQPEKPGPGPVDLEPGKDAEPQAQPKEEGAVLAARFHASKVERLEDGRLQITYDFSDPKQREAFELRNMRRQNDQFRKGLERGLDEQLAAVEKGLGVDEPWAINAEKKVLVGLGWQRLVWKHRLKRGEPFEVDVSGKCFDEGNAGVTLFDGNDGGALICATAFSLRAPWAIGGGRRVNRGPWADYAETFGRYAKPGHQLMWEGDKALTYEQVGERVAARPKKSFNFEMFIKVTEAEEDGAQIIFSPDGGRKGRNALRRITEGGIKGGSIGLAAFGRVVAFGTVRITGHIAEPDRDEEARRERQRQREEEERRRREEEEERRKNGGGDGEKKDKD